MEFKRFCEIAEDIESTSGKIEKTSLISDMLRESHEDINLTSRFIQGRIYPSWDDTKIDVGPKMMYKALADASGETQETVEDVVAEKGGIGEACDHLSFGSQTGGQQKLTSTTKNEISVNTVFKAFDEIAQTTGSGSQEKKVKLLSNVLLDVSESSEAKYFSRLALNEMRIGVGQALVRDAIADTFLVPKDSVEWGLMVTNDIGLVAETARDDGEKGLKNLNMEIGRPVAPMLAKDTTPDEAIKNVGDGDRVLVEPKHDGARLQIHIDGDDVSLYSRKLEDVTSSLPDVVEQIQSNINTEKAILDSEVIAYKDEEGEEALPFEDVLSRFRRKHNIDSKKEEIHLETSIFDVLYLEGEVLVEKAFEDRREILTNLLESNITKQWESQTAEEIQRLEHKALENGKEGIMVKRPSSKYLPNNRGWNWVKIKPEPETLECIVIGGEWGEGRREGVFGSFLLAVREEETNELKTVGKVATGIKEAELEELTGRFEPLVEEEKGKDVKFEPKVVFEVGFDGIQPSPQYSSGYGLRFPRFVAVREDKDIDTIDNVKRVEELS